MEIPKHYHNTNHLEGEELENAESDAIKMEQRIVDWLRMRAGQKFTPIEIWKGCCPDALLTSVRRSLSNQVDTGELRDTKATGEKKKERYGKANYFWYYPAPDESGQTKLF